MIDQPITVRLEVRDKADREALASANILGTFVQCSYLYLNIRSMNTTRYLARFDVYVGMTVLQGTHTTIALNTEQFINILNFVSLNPSLPVEAYFSGITLNSENRKRLRKNDYWKESNLATTTMRGSKNV